MITANRNPDPDGKLQDGALLDEGEFANHRKIGEWRSYKAND